MSKAITKNADFSQIKKVVNSFEKHAGYNEDVAFLHKYENKYIPDYLCWSYSVLNNSFKFIGNRDSSYNIAHLTPSLFLSKIKSCFRSQFIEAAKGFYYMLNNRIISKAGVYLSIIVPVKLVHDKFLLCKITIIPNYQQKEKEDFVVIVIPIKVYVRSNISFSILNSGSIDNGLTTHLKSYIKPPGIALTKKQQFVLSALHKGLQAPEIAEKLGVVADSIYKINRRLIDKISDFFELDYKNAKQAADYYYNSFT